MSRTRQVNHLRLRTSNRFIAACALLIAAPVHGQSVRISNLTDISFGNVANLHADTVQAQSVCAFSSTSNGRYSVQATGSGAGGAFSLSAGGRQLDYEVQWSSTPDQGGGVALTSGVAHGGFTSTANNRNCSGRGADTSASLVVILRAHALSAASAGSYSGTLTIMLAPE